MKVARSRLPWGGLALLATLALTACAQERDIAILRNDMERMNRQAHANASVARGVTVQAARACAARARGGAAEYRRHESWAR